MNRRNFLVNSLIGLIGFILGIQIDDIELKIGQKRISFDRFGRSEKEMVSDNFVNPLRFGAKGDGVSNDTESFQAALDSLRDGDMFIVPRGTYLVTNLVIPDKRGITLKFYGTIKAIEGGDEDYLISTYKYVNNIPEAGQPLKLLYPKIDGSGIVTNGVVIQTWDTDIEKPEISNCINGLKITAETKDGTLFSDSTLVNITINAPKISGNSGNGMWICDPQRNKVTDYHILHGFIYENEGYGIQADSCGGALIQGVHAYMNKVDLYVSIGSTAFRIHECYFEDEDSIKFRDINANTFVSMMGNIIKGDVNVYSARNDCGIKGMGNTFHTKKGAYTQVWGESLILSTSDTFESMNPYRVVGKEGTLNDSAPNKAFAQNCRTTAMERNKVIQGLQKNNQLNTVTY